MSEVKIYSSNVVLVEGSASEFVPNAKSAVGMHGFAVMVPPGEGSDWLLDLVWRIAFIYSARSTLLLNRKTVQKMLEAIMSANREALKRARGPEIENQTHNPAQRDQTLSAKTNVNSTPVSRSTRPRSEADPESPPKARRKAAPRKKS